MDIVEFEALHRGAVGQGGVRRRQALRRAPDSAAGRSIDRGKGFAQKPTPGQLAAEKRTTQGIEDQQLQAGRYFRRYLLVAQPGDKFGEPGCVGIGAGMLHAHLGSQRLMTKVPSLHHTFGMSNLEPRGTGPGDARRAAAQLALASVGKAKRSWNCSRSFDFKNFPVEFFGISATNTISSGNHHLAKRFSSKPRLSSALTLAP